MKEKSNDALAFTTSVLQMVFETEEEPLIFERFVDLVKDYTHCHAVGIRLSREDGNIAYVAHRGFSEEFLSLENNLSLHKDKCMCISVLRGDVPALKQFFTEGGSFFVNGTSKFLSTVSEEEKNNTRNTCYHHGYESVALIPMPLEKQILGLVQVVSKYNNQFPIKMVRVLEGAALALATAYQRIVAQRELKKQSEKLRALTVRLSEVEERERKRIAEDLHDNLGQVLAVAKMKSQALEARDLVELLDGAIAQTRKLTSELMSPVLYELGLAAALEQLVEDQRKHFSAHVSLSLSGDMTQIPINLSIVVYKAVRELLVNAAKHSQAKFVTVTLSCVSGKLKVQVKDDGVGFDVQSKDGFGLLNVKERLSSIGGIFLVSSSQSGTTVDMEIP